MHSKTSKQGIKLAKVIVVGSRVDDEIVIVDDDVSEAVDHGLDEPLERRRAAKEPHAGRDPLELPHAR